MDPQDFAAWLASKAPGVVVGRPGHALACPLCVWLEERVIIGAGGRRLTPADTLGAVPSWVAGFMAIGASVALDELDGMTAGQALAVLVAAEGGPLNMGLVLGEVVG